jgi:hypothetical protein
VKKLQFKIGCKEQSSLENGKKQRFYLVSGTLLNKKVGIAGWVLGRLLEGGPTQVQFIWIDH